MKNNLKKNKLENKEECHNGNKTHPTLMYQQRNEYRETNVSQTI
jgi:hypothetical protein